MTEIEWEKTKKALSGVFGSVKLKIDGYDVILSVERQSMKLRYVVYVNGFVKGEWIMSDCEIRNKFYQKHSHATYSDYKIKKAPKNIRKYLQDNNQQYETYTPWWSSFNRMKSHLIKNNSSIELIEL